MAKTAYISPTKAELDITVTRSVNPNVTVILDLGIPKFTIFSIKFPLIEGQPGAMQELLADAFHALMEEVSAFMMSCNFKDETITKIYAAAFNCYRRMVNKSDTQRDSGPFADRSIETIEGTFELPQGFIDETYSKVVTASSFVNQMPKDAKQMKEFLRTQPDHVVQAATFIQRTPKVRHLEMTTTKPPRNTVDDAARVIRQYRGRTLRQQPNPMYIVVYDVMGRPKGTLPLGPNFKNNLFKALTKKGSVDFSEPITFASKLDMKMQNAKGIPESVTLGQEVYTPEAYAGVDMALYRSNMKAGLRWLVKLADGRVVGFPNRPSIQYLKAKNFPVPSDVWRWNLIKEEQPEESISLV